MSDTLHFRRIRPQEGELYARFVHDFYASDGVDHPIPAEYIQRAFAEICRGDDYLICYILEENGAPAGYALLAKMYAQEAGGMAVWLDEFYLRPGVPGPGHRRGIFAVAPAGVGAAGGPVPPGGRAVARPGEGHVCPGGLFEDAV